METRPFVSNVYLGDVPDINFRTEWSYIPDTSPSRGSTLQQLARCRQRQFGTLMPLSWLTTASTSTATLQSVYLLICNGSSRLYRHRTSRLTLSWFTSQTTCHPVPRTAEKGRRTEKTEGRWTHQANSSVTNLAGFSPQYPAGIAAQAHISFEITAPNRYAVGLFLPFYAHCH